MIKYWPTYLVISVFAILIHFTICQDNFEINLTRFVSSFISQNFPNHCDLILFNQKYSSGSETENLGRIWVERVLKMKPNFVIHKDLAAENEDFLHLSLNSFDNVHRYSVTCHLVILILLNFEQNPTILSHNLFELLTKRFGSISRKDEDFYFAIVQNKDRAGQLLEMNFFSKIKYKILLYDKGVCTGRHFPWPGEPLEIDLNIDYHLDYKVSELFPDFLNNFQGRQIRVTAPSRVLFSLEIEQSNKSWRLKRGQHKYALEEIQRVYNFTYSVMLASGGGGTGFKHPNGTWVGTVSDLLYNRADLALITGQVFQRYTVIGFSRPFCFPSFAFTVGIPKAIFSYKTIFKPLELQVWVLFVISNGIFICVLLLSNKLETWGQSWRFMGTFEFCIGSIFEQGPVLNGSQNSRIICILLLFFLLIFSTCYKAKLFTFLIYPELTNPPDTFTELTQRTEFKYGLENAGIGAAIHSAFRASTNPIFVKINKEMSLERDSVQCFLKGLYSNFACLAYVGQINYIFNKNLSTPSGKYPFQQSKETTFTPHASGFAYDKRAIFRTNFDKSFGPILDNGIADQMEKIDFEQVRQIRVKWQQKNGIKGIFNDDYFYSGPKKLSKEQLNGVFIIYVILVVISLGHFIVELSFRKFLKDFFFNFK